MLLLFLASSWAPDSAQQPTSAASGARDWVPKTLDGDVRPMGIPADVLELENRSIGVDGEPTLGLAYERLLAEWRMGSRHREVGLHLMFLAWFLLCEPPQLTGFDENRTEPTTPAGVFREVHESFRHRIGSDAEMAYVIGLMAHLFPWLLGQVEEFEALAQEYRRVYRSLAPDGISPDTFSGRGACGEYFAGQAKVKGGY